MVQCKCCQKSISPNAQTCPHCGEPSPVPPAKPAVTFGKVLEALGLSRSMSLWLGAVFVGVGAATSVFHGLREAQQRRAPPAPASLEAPRDDHMASRPVPPPPAPVNSPAPLSTEPLAQR